MQNRPLLWLELSGPLTLHPIHQVPAGILDSQYPFTISYQDLPNKRS